jgi:hypothetical protein
VAALHCNQSDELGVWAGPNGIADHDRRVPKEQCGGELQVPKCSRLGGQEPPYVSNFIASGREGSVAAGLKRLWLAGTSKRTIPESVS